jgi:hypothetical protein
MATTLWIFVSSRDSKKGLIFSGLRMTSENMKSSTRLKSLNGLMGMGLTSFTYSILSFGPVCKSIAKKDREFSFSCYGISVTFPGTGW